MRICHISTKGCGIHNKLKETAIKNNLDVTIEKIHCEDIVISHNFTLQIFAKQHNLIEDFDAFIFRVNLHEDLSKIFFIAKTFKNHNKIIVNEIFCDQTTYSDKLSFLNIVEELNLNHLQTTYIDSKNLLLETAHELEFPFVLKDPYGWQGRNIFLVHNQKDLDDAIHLFPKKDFIIQKYLPQDYDIRVIVIGYKAIGAMKRNNAPGSFKSNLSAGGSAEHIALSSDLKKIAEKIAKHTKSAMLGIDFFIHNNTIYTNEIETCPGFKGFAKCTRTQPIYELLKYIITQKNSK